VGVPPMSVPYIQDDHGAAHLAGFFQPWFLKLSYSDRLYPQTDNIYPMLSAGIKNIPLINIDVPKVNHSKIELITCTECQAADFNWMANVSTSYKRKKERNHYREGLSFYLALHREKSSQQFLDYDNGDVLLRS
jgi:hypothetical protein